jgi:hypothetical protein
MTVCYVSYSLKLLCTKDSFEENERNLTLKCEGKGQLERLKDKGNYQNKCERSIHKLLTSPKNKVQWQDVCRVRK